MSADFQASGLHLPAGMAARLRFESFQILDQVDSAKRYHLTLDPAFPLALKLFEFPKIAGAVPMTWHERLEIFCPLAGSGTFRIGEREEAFEARDSLLIDNLRLHGVGRFKGHRAARWWWSSIRNWWLPQERCRAICGCCARSAICWTAACICARGTGWPQEPGMA